MPGESMRSGASVLRPVILSRGTSVVQDLAKARRFYEGFLGLECVEYEPGAMLARDRDPLKRRHRGGAPYWVMDVREVRGAWETNLFKHWGIDVSSNAEVDQVHAFASAHAKELGIKTVRKPRMQHGTYSFYLEDADGNWWEVERRPPGEENDDIFARGDGPI
jgi:catechol 2,3-dioxygenase-like lactoylglutathione lyase family enzyme